MLGKQQQQTLGWYVDLLKRYPGGVAEVRLFAGGHRYFTREMPDRAVQAFRWGRDFRHSRRGNFPLDSHPRRVAQ